jgi:ornithine cyclodeaminase/alanine dehydrogenase-like protein (mu-crystallin family)
MTWILKADDIVNLLDMSKAIEITEAAFHEQGAGLAVGHAPYAVNMMADQPQETIGPQMKQRLRVVSGGILGSKKAGLRCGTRGTPAGVEGSANVLLLYDCSGELLSVMGYPFSVLRTGATVGLAAKYMAREDSKRVGLLGTGNNAISLLRGVGCVRQIEEIRVYSRNEERRRAFCSYARNILGQDVRVAESPEEAISGTDIVLLATSSHEPVINPQWLEAGMHVSSMGPITELHPDVIAKADPFVVGSKDTEINNYYDSRTPLALKDLLDNARLQWDSIIELGELVTAKRPARIHPDRINVFHESQGGFGDVALGAAAFDEARRCGLGQWVSL